MTGRAAGARRIEYLPLDTVVPAVRNPKRHDGAAINASITKFGMAETPLIDERTGRLVAGHGRIAQLEAMRDAGQDPPDGVTVDAAGRWLVPITRGWASRSDAEAEAYLLASNKLTANGGWDDDQLGDLLTSLSDSDPDLLALTGFDADEIGALLGDDPAAGDGPDGGDGDVRRSLADRFGVPPFTLLDARQGYWQTRKRSWIALGLRSEEGRAAGMVGGFANANEVKTQLDGSDFHGTGQQSGTSIFDPVLCELLVRWYSAPGQRVLDPFAGGSVRGLLSARLGRVYTGVDLRPEQVGANVAQARDWVTRGLLATTGAPRWVVGDARDIRRLITGDPHDLMLTCPPYFDLEQYSDNPADLSTSSDYATFLIDYRDCLAAATDRMAPDAFAAIVTGALRDARGYVLDLPADTSRIMEGLGWRLYQDAVLATMPGTAALRAGRQFEALRKLTRVHQMVGVYHRGNIGTVRSWPTPEAGDVNEQATQNGDGLEAPGE